MFFLQRVRRRGRVLPELSLAELQAKLGGRLGRGDPLPPPNQRGAISALLLSVARGGV